MEYFDLHCDTPLNNNPVINRNTLKDLQATINFAFCFLRNETQAEKLNYFKNFLQSPLLKMDNLTYIFSLEGLLSFKNIEEVLYFIDHFPIKIVSFAWNEKNKWGCGCMEDNCYLTSIGNELLLELNKRDIIIDISHASEKTAEDILKKAKHVIATHSNFYDIWHHPRNLKKWQLEALKEKKGMVGLNFYMDFIGNKENFYNHIAYAEKWNFLDYLGIGSDFDGMNNGFISSPLEIPFLYNQIGERFSNSIAKHIISGKAFYQFYDFVFG